MIDSAINYLASQLNQYLRRRFDLSEDIVVVSNVLELDGSVAPHASNKMLVFLVGLEKDTVPYRKSANGMASDRSVLAHPPVFLNLHLMFAGSFAGSNYSEALKFVSNTVNFFQSLPVFDRENSPDLDEMIDKLTVEIVNLDVRDLSSLWGMLGGRYLPSVLYKVRMVSYAEGIQGQVETLRSPTTSLNQ